MVFEKVVTFDVADEIQVEFFAKLEGFEREFVALGIFRADAQNADARVFPFQNFARIDIAHHGKLREMDRLALDVRAGIEQHKFIALTRNYGGDAAAIHAGNAADLERRRRKNAAGVAEGNQRVRLAFLNEFSGAANRGILFLSLIHISEPTRRTPISYAVFCLK